MDITAIIQLISGVGFPIAVCVYIIYTLSAKIDSLTEVINNNTLVLQRLIDKMGVDENAKK